MLDRMMIFFDRGGVCMYPLTLFGILVLTVGFHSVVGLFLWRWRSPAQGTPAGWASEITSLVARREGYAGVSLLDSIELLVARLEAGLTAGLVPLRFLSQNSALLGFLGTVFGMVKTFNTVAAHGTVVPSELAGGIHEALFTTIYGLVIAIIGWCFAFLIEGMAGRHVAAIEADVIIALKSKAGES